MVFLPVDVARYYRCSNGRERKLATSPTSLVRVATLQLLDSQVSEVHGRFWYIYHKYNLFTRAEKYLYCSFTLLYQDFLHLSTQ